MFLPLFGARIGHIWCQGLFAHDNAHHALYMAYAAADCLDVENRFDDARWGNSRRIFETHVVED
jgi:hypothetical protein